MIGQKPFIFWITLSLALHTAGLIWCPTPSLFSPPSPAYLVIDIFSGPANSGVNHGLDNEPAGGTKSVDPIKNARKEPLQPAPQAAPKPQPKNLHNPLPTTPVQSTKVTKQEAVSSEPENIENPPGIPTAQEESITTTAPLVAITAEPLTSSQDNLAQTPESSTSSGLGSETTSSRAASGSPVETPMAYGTNPPPPYPSTARRRGWEGEVLLLVNVSARGEVFKVTVSRSSGYQILDRAALNAVYRWQFQAAQKNGWAVAGQVMVPIHFSIKDTQ